MYVRDDVIQTLAPWSFLVAQNHSHIALLTGVSSNIIVNFQNLDHFSLSGVDHFSLSGVSLGPLAEEGHMVMTHLKS